MLLTASLRAVALVLLGVGTAGSQPAIESIQASGWYGSLVVFEEELVVNVTVVKHDDLALMVGSVKNEGGENMAFFVPTSGEGLITSTWAITSLDQNHPSTLWSDGNCLLLEVRTTKEPEALVDRALWLGWGVRAADVTLLSAIQDEVGRSWSAQQMFMGLRGFYPDGETEAEELGKVVWESSKDATMQPKMLQDRWNEIAFRYLETRDRLRRVDALRIVEVPEPPVESTVVVEPER